jgi:glucodextranase-like protein
MKPPRFRRRLGAPALCALALAACGGEKAVDYGDPTELSRPTTVDGITAYVVSPRAFDALARPSAQIVVVAYLEGEPAPLRVRMGTDEGGEREAKAEGDPGPGQRFTATLPVLHGVTQARVTITDEAGTRARSLGVPLRYEGAEPAIAFRLAAGDGPGSACDDPRPLARGITSSPRVCALGRVSTRGAAATAVEVGVNGAKGLGVVPEADGSFSAELALAPNQAQGVEAAVVDAAGAQQAALHEVVHDDQPPELVLTQPSGPPRTDAALIRIEGRASDPNGLASLRVEAPGGNVIEVPAGPSFSVEVPLAPGDNGLAVVAVDAAANERRVDLGAQRTRVLTLRPPASNRGATSLLIDRAAFAALIDEDEQKAIKLVDVPLRATVRNALERIRDPERFGVDTGAWGQAERNLQRLLSMNPDLADMRGTSVEEMLDVAAGIGLPPARLLADLLDSGVTTPCVSLDVAADVMVEQLVGTHPNVARDEAGAPALSVSVYDVLQDLHTLSARFGPAGDHPGFLSGPTESQVLLPGFRFVLPVRSNLTEYDGVEASADAKSALFVLPAELPALELDFTSDAAQVVGLADEPAVDLVMAVAENPAFVPAGTSQTANPDPSRPGFARGNSPVWALPPWQTESLLAEIVYQAYAPHYQANGYRQTLHYDAGSIADAAVIDWNKGWVTVATAGGIGSPPHPQFAWDVLLEVAQVRLHDGGIAEGQANLAFALEKLPIGLTGDELVARIKPSLQAQAPKLSELIAGPAGLVTPRADFYFAPGDAGSGGFLFFRAPEDAPTATYPYATPGFYADARLTQKLSTKAPLAGTADAIHEKIAAGGEQTLYFADKAATVYELRVLGPADGGGVRVTLSPAGVTP